ncbi:MAG: helix-turn-helix domain-containing protein [Candidatus Cryptobacteroides sp.]
MKQHIKTNKMEDQNEISDKYSPENLPLWGLKEVTSEDVAEIGDFWHLPKSGFFLCREGTLTFGDHNRFYNIGPNDMIIYPIKTTVYIKHCSPDIKGIIGIAELDNILAIASKTVVATEGIHILSNPYIHLEDKERENIEDIASILDKRLERGDEPNSLPLQALWKALCYEIAEIYKKKNIDTKVCADRNDTVFLKFLFSLRDHLREHRDVKFYAQEQCLSPRYFSTLIKSRSGMTPLEIITRAALSDAKNQLSDPSLTVKQITYILGFPNPSFFGRWFKHNEGVSPAAFRKSVISE